MRASARFLWSNTDGAIAPTVALSLFALIAAGGIAFDYAHMASMHTELQQAADQAALAAATQLDGNSGAIQRATAAAQSLLTNHSLFADSGGHAVTVPTVVFYATAADAEADATPVSADNTARFVRVAVGAKKAYFALTPVVGVFDSGDIDAQAVAGLKSQVCRTPPLLLCNPDEETSLDFDPTKYRGKGIWLVANGGKAQWGPGNFGYLQNNRAGDTSATSGIKYLRELLGWNDVPGDCVDVQTADTKTGLDNTVTKALNTRFDIFQNGPGDQSCPFGGTCSPAFNAVKDVVRPPTGPSSASCNYTSAGWQLPYDKSKNKPLYYGSESFPDITTGKVTIPKDATMGLPRDICHVTSPDKNQITESINNCPDKRVGDGDWDRDTYFRVNYGWNDSATWQANTGLPPKPTRYEVYTWELAHLPAARPIHSGSLASYYAPQCGIPSSTIPDRRKLTVAVVNCEHAIVKGATQNVPVQTWVDVFLVEPSLDRKRTDSGDVYIEVIGETKVLPSKGSGTLRNVPYLIK